MVGQVTQPPTSTGYFTAPIQPPTQDWKSSPPIQTSDPSSNGYQYSQPPLQTPEWPITTDALTTSSAGSQFNPLPTTFPQVSNWDYAPTMTSAQLRDMDYTTLMAPFQDNITRNANAPFHGANDWQFWHGDGPERLEGLNPKQQAEMRYNLEIGGIHDILSMVDHSAGFVYPSAM